MTEPFVSGTSSKPNELCVINDCCYRPTNAISDHVTRGRPDTLSMETPALFSWIVIILTLNWTVIARFISIPFCFVLIYLCVILNLSFRRNSTCHSFFIYFRQFLHIVAFLKRIRVFFYNLCTYFYQLDLLVIIFNACLVLLLSLIRAP